MAYRELGMIEVREVPRRFTLGESVRAIARGTGVDRKAVAKCIAAGVATGLSRGGALPTDAQVAAIIAAIRPLPRLSQNRGPGGSAPLGDVTATCQFCPAGRFTGPASWPALQSP